MRKPQEIFNIVVKHLRAQGQKSCVMDGADYYICLYRSADGCKCPIGVLISDDEYKPAMERLDVSGLIGSGLLSPERTAEFREHSRLLRALQNIHDNKPIETWERNFRMMADDYKLTYLKP